MKFEDVIRNRTAIRNFSSREISDEDINKILNACKLAPTAKNNQPQVIYVVKSEDGLLKIDKASPCRYNARCVFIVCVNDDLVFKNDGHDTINVDGSIVGTHMMLEATSLGIDNIWVDMFNRDIIKKEFNIPENIIPVCIIPMGYRVDGTLNSVNHEKRKDYLEYTYFV